VAWARSCREALAPWRKPLARHDPAKIVTDLAIVLGLGGDCLAKLACELAAWMQLLAFTDADGNNHEARRWEPNRLRLRLFSTAARLARTGRRTVVHLARNGTWTTLLHAGLTRFRASPHPANHDPPVPATRTNPPRGSAPTRDDTRVPVLPDCKNQAPNIGRQAATAARDQVTKDPG
jgi:hypothetical protein